MFVFLLIITLVIALARLVHPLAGLVALICVLFVGVQAFRIYLRGELLDFAMLVGTARGSAAANLHRFRKGLIDFDELQQLWPKENDPLLDAIIEVLSYSSQPGEKRKVINRAINAIMEDWTVVEFLPDRQSTSAY